jgi:lysyl-tRNA synthetase class 2
LLDQDNDQIQQRRRHLEEIVALGHAAYTHRFDRSHTVSQLVEKYRSHAGKKEEAELAAINTELKTAEGDEIRLAGRIMTMRLMGKAAFAHLSDGLQGLQVYIRKNEVGDDAWALYQKLDLGDWIGVAGYLFITKTGELSVHVTRLQFLSKALLPMPDKYHGVTDKELRYRQRYVDLIASGAVGNQEGRQPGELTSREVFERRARIIREVRNFFDDRGFVEVETPMLTALATGAAAKPFVTHHNALDIDLYARIAPELYLKRLIVGGFERVYELNRNFRNEGISYKHNPEFTMLEFYWAYVDFNDLMDLTEELVTMLADKVCGTRQTPFKDHIIDFGNWQRLTMREAVLKYWPNDVTRPTLDGLMDRQQLEDAAAALDLGFGPKLNDGQLLGAIFEHVAEPHLIHPTFITEFPTELSPLSKQKADDPRFVERFELYIANMEVANAFSELNDPVEQRRRFEEQMKQRDRGDEEAMVMDEDYIRALSYGMPPTGGEGIGIDRLAMILTNQHSIRDVILFPHMRPETK